MLKMSGRMEREKKGETGKKWNSGRLEERRKGGKRKS